MRSIPRITRAVVVTALLAAMPHLALAQGEAPEVSFTGVVVQDGVKARAGAGRAFYVVGELKKGAVVQVDEVIFGWNKIVSPPGVHSYISKAFVDAKGNGRVGYVNSDRVEVKAGSTQGPGVSYRGQVQLNKGDSVEILAEEGSFYKITPPRGAYVFLPPGSVRRADPATVAAQQQESNSTPAPADTDQGAAQGQPKPTPQENASPEPDQTPTPTLRESLAQQPPTPNPIESTAEDAQDPAADDANEAPAATDPIASTDPTSPGTADVADVAVNGQASTDPADTESVEMTKAGSMQTAAVSEQLKALEARMIPLFMQPLEKQPIQEMIQAYQAIQKQSLPTIDRQIVSLRLAVLKRNQELAAALKQLQASAGEPTQVTLPPDPQTSATSAGPGPVEMQGPGVPGIPGVPVAYDAVGRLLASSVYDGVHLPRMFRVVDPASGRTILWVEPGGPVDPQQYLGKVVGLVGPQQYDPALKFNVLDVNRIDILEAQPTP